MIDLFILALTVSVSIVVLLRFSLGVWLCVALMPFSASYLMPRQMLGITGLNPFNIILVFTFLSFVLAHLVDSNRNRLPHLPGIFLLYLAMIVAAAVAGCFFIDLAPPTPSADYTTFQPWTLGKYLLEEFGKPLLILVVAVLAGVAAQRGRQKAIVWAVALSATAMVSAVLTHTIMAHVSLHILADASSRRFLSWTGMHANELGLFFNSSAALLFFSALAAKGQRGRSVLFGAAVLNTLAAALTFSRAAFLGLIVIAIYYFVTRRRLRELLTGVVFIVVLAAMLPEAFVHRATTGVDKRDPDAISAGRSTVIWPSLVPVFFESPFWGHGLSSTLWAKPNRRGMRFGHPHNAYLAALLDFGAFGSIVVAVFFISLWRRFRVLHQLHQDPLMRGFFEGAAVCILVLLTQGLTDDRFVPRYPHAWLWLAFGMSLGNVIVSTKNKVRKTRGYPTIGRLHRVAINDSIEIADRAPSPNVM